MEKKNYLRIYTLIILVSLTDTGCTLKIQEAAGCNNPGLFGCKDKPIMTESARDTSILNPADETEPENTNQGNDE